MNDENHTIDHRKADNDSINPKEDRENNSGARRWKYVSRTTGAVLWVLVFVGVYFIWTTSRERAAPQTQIGSAETKPLVLDRAAEDANDRLNSAATKGVVPQNADTKATQQPHAAINLGNGDISANSHPELVWDPKGIQDFELIERSGKTITKQDLLGRPWLVCFVFTRCLGPCPTVTGQMRILQDRLKESDVRLVTITVDPKNDTPEVLAGYAKNHGADPERWLFLTGDQNEIYGLIAKSFKMPVKELFGPDRKPGFEVIHSTNILHVDAQGRVQGKYNAADPSEMLALRKRLKLEAADDAQPPAAGKPRDSEVPQPGAAPEKESSQ